MDSGDIYVKCVTFAGATPLQSGTSNRQIARLTHSGDVKSWGITTDGLLLAFISEITGGKAVLKTIDLRTGQTTKSEPTDRRSRVDPTCGTLVLSEYWQNGEADGYRFRDLVTDREMAVPQSTSGLRCSSDHRYVLRLANHDELYLDAPTPSLLVKGVKQFNISANGNHIAYGRGDQLCVGTRDAVRLGKASCLGMTWTAGPMTVSNDGIVYFTEQTSQACKYKTEFGELSDPCPAIFIWRAGDPNDQLVSFNDVDPHLISPQTGLHVIELHRKWQHTTD